MSTTKQKILDTARRIFNERGYLTVTIRQIAIELGMSSGNLNYHYRKREDILEALYFEMVAHFDARVDALPQQEISLPQIRADVYGSMLIMADYRFFWTDLYQLLQISDAIQEHFSTALEQRKAGYQFLFEVLQRMQLMKSPSIVREYVLLAERMISYSNTWLYTSVLYPKMTVDKAFITREADALLLTLYPYLTDKGKEITQDIITIDIG